MADASTAAYSSGAAGDGEIAAMTSRTRFPDDFPELKECRDASTLAAAIKGAADTLTSVDLSGGACCCVVWQPMISCAVVLVGE